jgi:two-component system KDP operon response regulator KdpE
VVAAHVLIYAPGTAVRARLVARLAGDFALTSCVSLVETVRRVVAEPRPAGVLAVLDDAADPAQECELLRALGDFALITVWQHLDPGRAAACLDRGADGALTLDAPEFVRRVQAIVQRGNPGAPAATVLVAGELVVDRRAHTVRWRGRPLDVTPIEFGILSVLAEQPGRVVTTRELLTRVWGPAYADDMHYIRLYIGYLRAKLEDDPRHPRVILNQWGVGYRLAVSEPAVRLLAR